MTLLLPAIASKLLDDTIPWANSTEFHIDSFLDSYSLHDSNWIALHTNCAWNDSVVGVIRLDAVWNPSLGKPSSRIADWPFVLLRFDLVESIQLSGFSSESRCQRTIINVYSRCISDERARTEILDNFGASVIIHHFPLIHLLAYDNSGKVIPIDAPTA